MRFFTLNPVLCVAILHRIKMPIIRLLRVGLFLLTSISFGATGAINGFVRDGTNGEPLGYANVELKNTGIGTTANQKGYFYLGAVAPGEYELEVSFIGYGILRKQITVVDGKLLTLNLELNPEAVPIGEVNVTAERARFEREVEVSASRLDTRQLVLIPRLGGEVDLFRTVQLLPGVITVSDFSNKLYIRGGSPDQNLILLDGITVYNPSHLFGIFSPFVTEAVSEVILLAGGFGARYGGRLSSVIDVTTREGNSRNFSGSGSVSIIAARGITEGPIPHGSFILAGRRTYLPDLLLKTFNVRGIGYYFYDLMGKINYQRNENHRLCLTGLAAKDVLSFWDPNNPNTFKAKLPWGNQGISLRWNAIFTPIFYGELMFAWSNFFSRFNVDFTETNGIMLETYLNNWTLKGDFTAYPADRHTLGFGLDAQANRMEMNIKFDTVRFRMPDTLFPLGFYLEDKWELLKEKFFIKPGLRVSYYYSNGGRLEPEPRLGIKIRFQKNTALNFSIGRFTQPLITLNSTEAILSIYDIWVPVPENRKIPSAYHYIAGIERWLKPDLSIQLETYYKDFDNLLETRYGDFFTRPESLLPANGYSWGADILLRKTSGRATGWLAYSYMWTRRSIDQETYFPHYDRRHNLNLVVTLPQLVFGLDLNLRWTLGSGLPYSGIVGYYLKEIERPGGSGERQWEFIPGPRDAFRYPVYHRLDVGLETTVPQKLGRFEISFSIDIINLYNAKNVLLYYWDFSPSGLPQRRQINMLPILPTIGLKIQF
ncbi:MAG: TonB-dependent receptor [bacterium]